MTRRAPRTGRDSATWRLLVAVVEHPGQVAPWYDDTLQLTTCFAPYVLYRLRRRGLVTIKRERHGASVVTRWVPTRAGEEAVQARPESIRELILRTLATTSLQSASLAARLNLNRRAVCEMLRRLVDEGLVKTQISCRTRIYVLAGPAQDAFDDDDDAWTPRPFINPIRARALGLPTGRAA